MLFCERIEDINISSNWLVYYNYTYLVKDSNLYFVYDNLPISASLISHDATSYHSNLPFHLHVHSRPSY